jgi:hypothetical protein
LFDLIWFDLICLIWFDLIWFVCLFVQQNHNQIYLILSIIYYNYIFLNVLYLVQSNRKCLNRFFNILWLKIMWRIEHSLLTNFLFSLQFFLER